MTFNHETEQTQIDYKSLVERSLQGIIVFDRHGISFANQAAVDICGYSVAELKSMSVEEIIGLVHPEDRQAIANRIANRLRAEQEPDRYNIRFIHKSGTVKWTELQSMSQIRDQEHLIQVHLVDLTARILAERALKKTESQLRTAIESLPFDFYALDLEGRYVLQNSICIENWGNLLGKTPANAEADAETRALWEENNRRALSGDVVSEEVQFQLKGEQRDCFNIIGPVINGDDIIGIQGVNIDVTDLRKAEKEKAVIEKQLLHSQKMEAVSTLASGVAHDFNNLLMCILGNLDLLKQRIGDGHSANEEAIIDVIESAAVSASNLTKQLLNLTRHDVVEHVPVNLGQLVKETVSLIENCFGKLIAIETQLDAQEPIVDGDKGQLQQVLVNLAVNSRDAMPEGGTLSIIVQEMSEEGQLKIVVADTGTGIPSHIQERVFEPFFTSKEPGMGTGMGLAVVYSIVEGHGGVIAVESKEGKGTRFEISLPLKDRKEPRKTEDLKCIEDKTKPKTILIVEDDEVVRQLVGEQIDSLGHRAICARNGLEALNIYQEQDREIDLVLLDIVMPVMDGAECQREIRKIDQNAKIVAMTGRLTSAVNQQLASQGVLAVLKKPFVISDLRNVLARAL